jgi:hypothetical protein
VIVASACLTDAIRSQGFSPSQRFDPTGALWLCFKPLPPIGFHGLQSFSRRASRCTSRHTVLSCRSTAIHAHPEPRSRAERRPFLPASRRGVPRRSTQRTGHWRPRLQSLGPTKRPTLDAGLFTQDRAAALLAFVPSGVSHSVVGPKPSPHTLVSTRAYLSRQVSYADRCPRVSIRPSLAITPRSDDNPPEVCHLMRTA